MSVDAKCYEAISGAGLEPILDKHYINSRTSFTLAKEYPKDVLQSFRDDPSVPPSMKEKLSIAMGLSGGRGQASGFIMRMMAENKLKHKGQYRNPSTNDYGSKMRKFVPFNYNRLANKDQKGKNESDYGASPFIQRHFGSPDAVPFVPKAQRGAKEPVVEGETEEQKAARLQAKSEELAQLAKDLLEKTAAKGKIKGFLSGKLSIKKAKALLDKKKADKKAEEEKKKAEPPPSRGVPAIFGTYPNLKSISGLTIRGNVKWDYSKGGEPKLVVEPFTGADPYPQFGNVSDNKAFHQLMVASADPPFKGNGWRASYQASYKGKPIFLFKSGDVYSRPEGKFNPLDVEYLGYFDKGVLVEPDENTEFERGIMGVWAPDALKKLKNKYADGRVYRIYDKEGNAIDPFVEFNKIEAEANPKVKPKPKAEAPKAEEPKPKMGALHPFFSSRK